MTGRKRHIVVDTMGLLLHGLAVGGGGSRCQHPGSGWRQDRDGQAAGQFPQIATDWADAGDAGQLVEWAQTVGGWLLTVVKRKPNSHHFEVLPRRWVLKRTLAWLSRCPRLSKDYEERTESSEAWVHIAMIHLMLKRLQPA